MSSYGIWNFCSDHPAAAVWIVIIICCTVITLGFCAIDISGNIASGRKAK